MAISVVAAGTTQQAVNTGTASISVTPTLPAGSAAGDRVYLTVANVPATTTPTTPAGWNLISTQSLGTGTLGATAGPRRMSVYYRDYDGAWSMPSVVLPSVAAPALLAETVAIRRATTESWEDPTATQGSDVTVTTTPYSATGAAILGYTTGDWAMAALVGPGLSSITSGAITATGATFGTVTERADWASVSATNGVHAAVLEALITAGPASAAPVNTATVSTSGQSDGGTIFIRQTVITPSVTFDAVYPDATGSYVTGNVTTTSWSHTASGSYLAAVVGVMVGVSTLSTPNNDATVTASVTWGGTPMQSLGIRHSNASTAGYVQLFGLVNIPAGAAQVVVTTAANATTIIGGSITFNNASGGFGTAVVASGSSAAVAVSITGTDTRNMLVDAYTSGNNTTVGVSSKTPRWLRAGDNSSAAGNGGQSTTRSSLSAQSMSYTITSDFWAIAAVEVIFGQLLVDRHPIPDHARFRAANW